MNAFQSSALRSGFALALLAAACASAGAVTVTNGSLTGPIVNGGVPPGWTLMPGSPDTNDFDHNVGGGTPFSVPPSGPSPDGGTWVGLVMANGGSYIEQFGQSVTGLTIGEA